MIATSRAARGVTRDWIQPPAIPRDPTDRRGKRPSRTVSPTRTSPGSVASARAPSRNCPRSRQGCLKPRRCARAWAPTLETGHNDDAHRWLADAVALAPGDAAT
jgi:hypothetical protein